MISISQDSGQELSRSLAGCCNTSVNKRLLSSGATGIPLQRYYGHGPHI